MKRSRIFIANVALGIVFCVFLLISVLIMLAMRLAFQGVEQEYGAYEGSAGLYEEFQTDTGSQEYEDGLRHEREVYLINSITGAVAKPLGSSYKGWTAQEGYQYYSVSMQVANAGTDYIFASEIRPMAECEAEDGARIYPEADWGYENILSYSSKEIIPSCQTGIVSCILEVKDGVEDVTLKIPKDYSGEEYASYVLSLP